MEKSNEEKSKHVSLAQQNDFGPAFLYSFEETGTGTAQQSITPAVD
jgi:hypothetical protein